MIKRAAIAFTFGMGLMTAAQAGCLTGAAVGGVVGHVAGHHGLAGAAVGCAVGHHRANKAKEQNTGSSSDTAPK